MKKSSLLALGLATLLLGACSSDDLTVGDGGQGNLAGEGKAYVSLNISMPAQANGARTGANGTYDDGEKSEYDVKNISVLVFDNASKKFERVYSSIDNTLALPENWKNSNYAQITQKEQLPAFAVEDNKAKDIFVLLNYKDLAQLKKLTTEDDLNNIVLKDVSSSYASTRDGFMMCNAPLKNGDKVETFVTVTPEATKEGALAAGKNNNIYVERLVGKVELVAGTSDGWNGWQYTVPDANINGTPNPSYSAGAKIRVTDWELDVTNNSSYLVRHVAANWLSDTDFAYINSKNRFYMETPVGNGSAYQRINWAMDPNYNTQFDKNDFTYVEATAFDRTAKKLGKKIYCYENTFNVKNQRQDRTTRCLIKASFVPKGFKSNESWFTIGASDQPRTAADCEEIIKTALTEVLAAQSSGESEEESTNNNIVVNTAEMSGTIGEEDFTNWVTVGGQAITKDQSKSLYEKIGTVKAYNKGVCYYVIRVKHFGDSETPWGDNTNAPLVNNDKYWSYGGTNMDTNENKYYLGRYGVVRNNWYVVTINSISNPGTPDIPEPGDEIDDEHNYWLSATINILAWTKRTQTEDL